jgi:hypothetical protein
LRQVLLLIGNIIQRYEGTSLYPSLAGAINPQLEQSLALLKRLSETIAVYRQSLFPTVISRLWHRVCGNSWNPDELLMLKAELSAQRMLFGVFLHALNSSVISLYIITTPSLTCPPVSALHGRSLVTRCVPVAYHRDRYMLLSGKIIYPCMISLRTSYSSSTTWGSGYQCLFSSALHGR